MSTTRQIATGTFWNWTGMAVSACISFALSPFIVHHLGNTAYGTWILINSIVEYLFLLDFGMRGAVTKFVASARAQQDHLLASRAFSAAFWFRVWLAVGIVAISALLAVMAPRFFHLPILLIAAARWALLFNGTAVAISLTCGVFGGVLAGIQRFDRLSLLGLSQSVMNAVGVVILLRHGKGIAALAALQVAVALIIGAATIFFAHRSYPELAVRLRWPDRETVRQVWGYSGYLFIIAISGQVIYYTDNIVIGVFLPVGAVAVYGIGAALTNYLRSIIASLATTFMPIASGFHARGEQEQLRRLLIHGTRVVLLVALPIEIGFFLRGPTFIRLWMGPEYQFSSGRVLQVLTIAWILIAGNYCSGNVLYGMAKHARIAKWTIVEATTNLALSIVLIKPIGILGVAWGTVIPSLFIHGLLWPNYITEVLEIPYRRYIWEAWIRPMIAALPFASGCYFVEHYWPVAHLGLFFFQMLALIPLMGIGVGFVFLNEVRNRFRRRATQRENKMQPDSSIESSTLLP